MDIKDILSVGLTAEDFDVILKGLDAIPEKESWQMIATETVGIMLSPTKVHADERLRKMEKRSAELKREEASKKEDFIVLKSKLILLKRHLLSNEAVRMAQEIVAGGGVKIDISQKKLNPLKKLRIYLEGWWSLAKLAF